MQTELKKIKAFQADVFGEISRDEELYNSIKREEADICASMTLKARRCYEMVQKVSVEGDRLEKRHKHAI